MRERPPVPAVVGESARQLLFVVVEVVVVVRPSLGEKVVRQLPLAVGVLVESQRQPEGVEGVGPAALAPVPVGEVPKIVSVCERSHTFFCRKSFPYTLPSFQALLPSFGRTSFRSR